jgi:two-component system chemotaxis sensor kinase CheA
MDMSQYQEIFLEESFENLQNLNEYLLELEGTPGNLDTVNKIFRVAHTLKGMAASMGFNDMAELTHSMESVLDKFRSGSLKVTSDVITLLFSCLDTLESIIKNVQNGTNEKIDIISLMNQLNAEGNSDKQCSSSIKDDPASKSSSEYKPKLQLNIYDKNVIKEAAEKGYNVLCIDVELYKDCLLKAARAFLVYKTLEDNGEIIKCEPPVDDIEQENFDNSFSVILLTLCPQDAIKKLLDGISEIKCIKINDIKESYDSNKDCSVIPSPTFQVSSPDKTEDKPAEKPGEGKLKKPSHQSVRVDLDRLDTFMSLVGELVIHKTRLEEICSGIDIKELKETLDQVGRISSDLQDLVMKIRMVPVDKVFNRFPRMMRDLALELNKQISFIIEGEDTELDRTVIDELGEPLIHLLRNSADHGIESPEERKRKGKDPTGIVKLSAFQQGNRAIIKLEDDGAGLNIAKIKNKAIKMGIDISDMSEEDLQNLIFMQGFSTSDKVTDVSGRGVGMDAVKSKISSLGGTIDVISKTDKGSAIIISLPLTLSIIQVLLVKLGGESFGISLGYIERVVIISEEEIKQSNGRDIIIYQDKVIPLIRLCRRLNITPSNNDEKYAVITKIGERNAALLVDSLIGQQEIVIKPLGKSLNKPKEYVGATILGDGLVTLILDASAFI